MGNQVPEIIIKTYSIKKMVNNTSRILDLKILNIMNQMKKSTIVWFFTP